MIFRGRHVPACLIIIHKCSDMCGGERLCYLHDGTLPVAYCSVIGAARGNTASRHVTSAFGC